MKVLMVSPRFGPGIVGGAENLIRGLALRCAGEGLEIEVATTCAVDQHTWEDALPPGETADEGVLVRRFPVGARDAGRHERLHRRLLSAGRLGYLEELELMASSAWSPGLQRFVEEEGRGYGLMVFGPYLAGTSFWGLQAWPGRSALLPCLHDEPYAYMASMRAVIEAAAGCIFNAPAEERLARRLCRVRDGGVVGMGFEPTPPPERGAARRHGLGRYLIYAGRIEEGKRVDVVVEHVARFAAREAPDLRLVLIGRGSYRVPRAYRDTVLELGYVSEAEKRALFAEAVALVNPSELESLSVVLLEAWREGTPALVASGSDVMAEHCARSGAGLTFASADEFDRGLRRLLDDPDAARAMGAAGRDYVLEAYGWPAVRARFRAVVERLAVPALTPAPAR